MLVFKNTFFLSKSSLFYEVEFLVCNNRKLFIPRRKFSFSLNRDILVEMATAFEKDDWILTMEICNEAKKCPNYYCGIIIERMNDQNRDVALKALNVSIC